MKALTGIQIALNRFDQPSSCVFFRPGKPRSYRLFHRQARATCIISLARTKFGPSHSSEARLSDGTHQTHIVFGGP